MLTKGGGLAVPLEIPIVRELACDYYYGRDSSRLDAAQSLTMHLLANPAQECQIPEIAKLAGAAVTAARILNALMSTHCLLLACDIAVEHYFPCSSAVLCLTVYSDLLSRYGRKPMFAFTALCLTTSILLFGLGGRFTSLAS